MKKSVTGRYNKKITLQTLSGVIIKDGVETPNFTDGATVWASCEPLKGKEFFEAEAAQSEISMRFRIRYMSGLTAKKTRVKYGAYTDDNGLIQNRYWNIEAIIDANEEHRELQLMAKVVE